MSGLDLARYQDPLTIQRSLFSARTIAVVGLSANPLRASYFVGFYLQRHGYRVIPVNPRESQILGETSFASLREVPVPVDIVNVFRAPAALPAIAADAVASVADSRWSWTVASRSSMRATSAACTGSASIPSASPRCAAGCSSQRYDSGTARPVTPSRVNSKRICSRRRG
jgi:predicted CoA-binding protein